MSRAPTRAPARARARARARTLPALLASLALSFIAAACGGAADIEDLRDRPRKSNAGVDWRDQVIYQIMIDRFSNGDPSNDYNVEVSVPGRYHGGDWQGVIDRLDYLEELGVTALWISPTFMNTEEDAGFASYHGYWPYDFTRPNHHFGDLEKLRELVDAAHDRDMLVILDVIVNHVGQLFFYDINGNGRPDDWLSGGGTSHTCVQICANPERASECSPDEQVYCQRGSEYLERIIEWDPEYDPRGVQGWTSLGFRGPAEIRFTDWPELKRTVPPRPPKNFGWPEERGWFDSPEWFNRMGRVYLWWHESDYSKDFVREQETLGDFPGGLKDLNTDNPLVQDALIEIYKHWIDVADFDGFRIDTLKHIDRPELDLDHRGFWGRFTTEIRAHARSLGKHNFFMFGEAFDGNDALSGAYTFPGRDAKGAFQRLDSTFYFSQYYRVVKNVIMEGAPTRNLECLFGSRMGSADPSCADDGFPTSQTIYDQPHATREDGGIGLSPQQVMVNFLDNHDLPRFIYQFEESRGRGVDAIAALKNGLFFLYTWDGIPCLYYGTEQAFAGGTDPGNREDMWSADSSREGYAPFSTDHEMFRYVKALIALRKQHEPLRRGATDVVYSTASPRGQPDSGIVAYERRGDDGTVLVVLNTADAQASRTCAVAGDATSCMTTSFAAGTVLRDVAPGSDGQSFTVGAGGRLDVAVPARGGRVLVP
jgi:alpha-amylase